MIFGSNLEVQDPHHEYGTSRYAMPGCSERQHVVAAAECGSRAGTSGNAPVSTRVENTSSRELLRDHIEDFKHLQTIPKVTTCIDAWNLELTDDLDRDYLLDGLTEGFNIIDSDLMPHSMKRSNYKSTAGVNKAKVETRIREEIEKGNYVVCDMKPRVCSALGAIPKGENAVRLIHDLSRPDGGLNAFAWDTSVSFSTLDMATAHLPSHGFMAKIDLAAAYRSIPIHPSNYGLTGLRWKFEGDSDFTNMFDARLPFGAAKSCQIFQRVSDAVVRMMIGRD